jgi:hypothetical protein
MMVWLKWEGVGYWGIDGGVSQREQKTNGPRVSRGIRGIKRKRLGYRARSKVGVDGRVDGGVEEEKLGLQREEREKRRKKGSRGRKGRAQKG